MKFQIKANPRKEYGEVTRFGVKVLDDGSQWVINAYTGEPLLKNKAVLVHVTQRGSLWVPKGKEENLDPTEEGVHFSLWRQ